MAEQQVTAALSAMTAPKPQASFGGLPRELRDQIYGYLLHSDYTSVQRPSSHEATPRRICKGHRFHTNILAVNRIIHDEAEEYVYTNNVFVVADLQWPGLEDKFRGLSWVGLIGDKHASEMTCHSLLTRITRNRNSLELHRALGGSGTDVARQKILFLAEDLPSFCVVMTHHLSWGARPMVAALQSSIILLSDGGKPTDIELQLLAHRFRGMDQELQKSLLLSFSDVIGASANVSVTGIVADPVAAATLIRSMSTSLSCFKASMWGWYKNMSKAKDVADDSAHNGQPQCAIGLLDHLGFEVARFLRVSRSSEVGSSLYHAICLLSCDITLTRAHMALMEGDFLLAARFMAACEEVMVNNIDQSMGMPAELVKCAWHLTTFALLYRDREWSDDSDSSRFVGLSTQGRIDLLWKALLSGDAVDAWQIHDANVLRNREDQGMTITEGDVPFEASSFHTMPVRCVNFRKANEHSKRPAWSVGWHDMRIFNNGDQALRDQIHREQARGGLPLTKFD